MLCVTSFTQCARHKPVSFSLASVCTKLFEKTRIHDEENIKRYLKLFFQIETGLLMKVEYKKDSS